MRSFIIAISIFLIGCSLVNAVSPRFGSATVPFYGGEEAYAISTGGALTAPFVFPPFPETYDEVYCSMQAYGIYEGQFVNMTFPEMSCCRVHHTAVIYRNNYVFLFGGAGENNQVEMLDIEEEVWTIVDTVGTPPSGRYGHSAALVEYEMFIFGGVDAKTNQLLDDLWVLNLESLTWNEIPTTRWSPKGRVGATITNYYDVGFVLFGGSTNERFPEFYNDVWIFDALFYEWQHVTPDPSSPAPSPRSMHAAGYQPSVLYSKDGYAEGLVVYGGVTYAEKGSEDDDTHLNDMWVIDPYYWFFPPSWDVATAQWEDPDYVPPTWIKLEYKEDENVPVARKDFAYVFADEVLTIFGGQDEGRETRADIWSFWLSYRFDRVSQRGCFPGYEFPWCTLNCRFSDYCNWHGTCLPDGTCACDDGWKGATCDYNVCDGYRGFTTDALNEILLPKSIESIYVKLDVVFNKLLYIRELLPSVDNTEKRMNQMAVKSYNFYQFCMVDDLCETTEGFEEAIGCDIPCGSETYCVINDTCVNGHCVGGKERDCNEEYAGNMCVNSWCDEENGCMHSTISCVVDPVEHPCATVYCDPAVGCVYEEMDCDDHDCCTIDYCDPQANQCVHINKCVDENPCTVDFCNQECDWGTCDYTWEWCCYPNEGQNEIEDLLPGQLPPRQLGVPLIFTGAAMVPPEETTNMAFGYFWLRGCGKCELYYRVSTRDPITGTSLLKPNSYEEGTHIYALANEENVAGVVGGLPLGDYKEGSWNYCKAGLDMWDMLSGNIYIIMHFNTGNIRTQLHFVEFDFPFVGTQ